MKTSLNWLRSMLPDLHASAMEVAAKMGVEAVAAGDDHILTFTDYAGHVAAAAAIAKAFDVSVEAPVADAPARVAAGEASNHISQKRLVQLFGTTPCCGVVVVEVQVAASPDWLATRLSRLGVLPTNNVTDAMHLVELEYGAPVRAFDIDVVTPTETARRVVLACPYTADAIDLLLPQAASLLTRLCKGAAVRGVIVAEGDNPDA